MVMHQGLIKHFLVRNIDSYGLISVTEEGLEFLKNPHPLMLAEDRNFTETNNNDDDDDDDLTPSAGKPVPVRIRFFCQC